jgi:hydrogenase expression/formation protein HypE
MSKFSLDVLQRCVYPYFQSTDEDVVLGSTFGEDVALTRVGGDLLASHVDPIVGAVKEIGRLAVHVACNDIATCGVRPRWIQLLVLVPGEEDVDLLKNIMSDVSQTANEVGVAIIGGHTGYSSALSRPLVAVTAFAPLNGKEPVLTRGAQPGDHILVTKGIPLEGTAILANDFAGAARELGLTQGDFEEAKALMRLVSVIPEAVILGEAGASAMHDVTRGGLLETLLEMASLSEVGIRIDQEKIPMPAVGVRFAEAFGFDPLRMISSGTLVAAVSQQKLGVVGEALVEAGIRFADVGMVAEGQGVHVGQAGEVRDYADVQPEADELARMWEVFSPDVE